MEAGEEEIPFSIGDTVINAKHYSPSTSRKTDNHFSSSLVGLDDDEYDSRPLFTVPSCGEDSRSRGIRIGRFGTGGVHGYVRLRTLG